MPDIEKGIIFQLLKGIVKFTVTEKIPRLKNPTHDLAKFTLNYIRVNLWALFGIIPGEAGASLSV